MATKVDVFMPIFVADLLRDTDDLSSEEFGAYMRLLLTMWSRGGVLPNDRDRLSRLARVDRASLDKMWPVLGKFFLDDGNALSQKRLSQELERARLLKAAAVDRAQKGGRAAAAKRQEGEEPQDPPPGDTPVLQAPLQAPPQAPLQLGLESASGSLSESGSGSGSSSGSSTDGEPRARAHAIARPERQPDRVFARAMQLHADMWGERHGQVYRQTAKDRSQLGRLLQTLRPEELPELPTALKAYFADNDPFVVTTQAHSLAYFCTSGGFNKYRTKAAASGLSARESKTVEAGKSWADRRKLQAMQGR